MSDIKKYYSPFDAKVSGFVNSGVLEQEIEQTFQQHLAELKCDDSFRNAGITAIENQNKEEYNMLEALKKKERKSKKRKLSRDVETKLEDAFKNKKIKTMIDFDRKECNSIKSIALKVNMNINGTLRFINGKMFAKILLKCLVYDITDIFCFPINIISVICTLI